MKLIITLMAVALLSACGHKSDTALTGKAQTLGFSVGTLSVVGSFDFETAPVYTRVVVLDHQALVALNANAINKSEAQSIYDSAAKAKEYADDAMAACKEDAQGKCLGDKTQAEGLLSQAVATLASIK